MRPRWVMTTRAIVGLAIALSLAGSARADEPPTGSPVAPPTSPAPAPPPPSWTPPPPRVVPEEPARRRIADLGVGWAVGAIGISTGGYELLGPWPHLLVGAALHPRFDLELDLPVGSMVLALADHRTTFLWADLFLRWRFFEGRHNILFLDGGIGGQYVEQRGLVVAVLEVPVRVGWMLRLAHEKAFTLALRPFVDWIVPVSSHPTGAAYGALVEAAFHFWPVTIRR